MKSTYLVFEKYMKYMNQYGRVYKYRNKLSLFLPLTAFRVNVNQATLFYVCMIEGNVAYPRPGPSLTPQLMRSSTYNFNWSYYVNEYQHSYCLDNVSVCQLIYSIQTSRVM